MSFEGGEVEAFSKLFQNTGVIEKQLLFVLNYCNYFETTEAFFISFFARSEFFLVNIPQTEIMKSIKTLEAALGEWLAAMENLKAFLHQLYYESYEYDLTFFQEIIEMRE